MSDSDSISIRLGRIPALLILDALRERRDLWERTERHCRDEFILDGRESGGDVAECASEEEAREMRLAYDQAIESVERALAA